MTHDANAKTAEQKNKKKNTKTRGYGREKIGGAARGQQLMGAFGK